MNKDEADRALDRLLNTMLTREEIDARLAEMDREIAGDEDCLLVWYVRDNARQIEECALRIAELSESESSNKVERELISQRALLSGLCAGLCAALGAERGRTIV